MTTSILRSLIRETLLDVNTQDAGEDEFFAEGEEERSEISKIAKNVTKAQSKTHIRDLGRTLKRMWQKEADIASFKSVTFIHWQDIHWMSRLVSSPKKRDEISAIPYRSTPWKQLSGLAKISKRSAIGAIIEGWPTLIANADLNSHAFRDGKIPYYEIPEEKQDQRRKSSGWNKYPGASSLGSTESGARSWEDFLVYSADEIVLHDKITFDVGEGVVSNIIKGWPEALIDNWRVTGLVIPDSVIENYGIDDLLEILKRNEFPSGVSVYNENGEEKSETI
jgi:hypothetical protein